MADAALSEPRAAALESSGPSNAMKPAASKTRGGWRADVRGSHPAAGKSMEAPAGMESPDARKTWGGRRADMDPCSPAKPRDAAAGMETPDARQTWGSRRADADSRGPAKPMQAAAANKTWRRRGADVGDSSGVELMKSASAKAAVESTAANARGNGRARVETGRRMDTAGAEAPRRRTRINGARRLGMRDDDAVAMMSPVRWDDDRGHRTGPTKAAVPLIAARIVAGAAPTVVVPAIAVVLDCLNGR